MKAIINRDTAFGTLNGVIAKNSEIQALINKNLKTGTAKKLVDTETTLMYELGDSLSSNLHPVFQGIFNAFGMK